MNQTQARMTLKAVRARGVPPDHGELEAGTLVGRGDGAIDGAIKGAVTWALFETPGDLVCSANLVGMINAEDGSAIEFSTLGFFGREEGGNVWHLRSGISFKNGTGSLSRFTSSTGVITGRFDMSTYLHDHLIDFAPARPGSNDLS